MYLNLYLSQEEKLPIVSQRGDSAEKRSLVVTLNEVKGLKSGKT